MKARIACSACGKPRLHQIHVGYTQDHAFADPRRPGLKPISEGKRVYLDSQEHIDAYSRGESTSCAAEAAGVPTRCLGRLTPHHIAPRGSFGGQRAAEKFPVVTLCEFHNGWVQQDAAGRDWATTHYFHRDGTDWPFLMSPRD